MFIPIILPGSVPRGKLGLIYCGAWLLFAFWMLFYVSSIFQYKINTDPRLHDAIITVSIDPTIVFVFSVLGSIMIVVGILLVGYACYKWYKGDLKW